MQGIINLTILLLCLVQFSYSNSYLYINEIDTLNLPTINSKLYFFNDNILPVNNLTNDDLIISSNSRTLTNLTIQNTNAGILSNKKVIIYFDLSLDSTKKEHVIKIITNLLKFNIPKQIEYYLICFDNLNYDFKLGEIDSIELNSTLRRQEIEYISNIEYTLNFKPNNPIEILKSMVGEKEILCFSDSPIKLNNESALFNILNNNQITLSFYDMNINKNDNFKQISNKVNGFYVPAIDSVYDASRVLNANLLRYSFTNVNYDIKADCNTLNSNTIQMKYYSNSFTFDISVLDSLKPKISSDPIDKNFANILPGKEDSEEFFIRADNSDIYLYNIKLSDNYDGVFTLFGGIDETIEKPYLLKKGQTYPLQIKFTPKDSALVFTQILIKSDACFGNKINITGGFPNTPPLRKTLRLSNPDCQDTLFVNDVIQVQWEGVLPRDVVQLEYSLNNGANWDTLAKNVVGLNYDWVVPNTTTNTGLVRVLQLWPNNIGKTINLNHLQFSTQNDNKLNSAFFSPDGNYIVTAASDGLVRVWNSNSGELVQEFRGYRDVVNYAIYSPNGEYIAACSKDGKAIVWYANPNSPLFGEIFRSFDTHKGEVNSVDFSINNSELITSCLDGKYRIFDLKTGQQFYEKNEGQNIRFTKFAPNNKFYIVGLRNGIANAYAVLDNKLIKSFNTSVGGGNQPITHIDISPDSKLISITNKLTKEISVWDYPNDKKIYSFYHPPSFKDSYDSLATPNSSFFYYSNKDTLLISSAGNEAIRWDLTDGDSTASFKEHTSFVMTTNYNFDASRVVTSSWDGYAKIWKLKERDIQMDTSDCNFVILDPLASIRDFAFDYTMLGKSADSSFSALIQNNSSSSILIDSISIKGRDRDEFKFKNNHKYITLNPNENYSLDIVFTPNQVGERMATLELTLPAKVIYKYFSGFGYKSNIQKLTDTINFGNLVVAETKEINNLPLLRNLDPKSLEIDSIKIYDLDYDNFTYLSDNSTNNTLPANIDLYSNLQFQTDTLGKFNSILKIYHSDETKASKYLVSGAGVPPRVDTLTIKINSQDVVNNQIIECPLLIDKISNLGIIESISGFNFRISYNKTMLEPLFNYKLIYDIGDIRTIEFDINLVNRENLLLPDAELSKLTFRVGLGKTTYSDITISSVTPIGEGKIVLSWNSPRINQIDICKEGGVRLIDTEGKFELSQNFPNPVISNTNIEFEIIEKSKTNLYIIDINGNKVKEIVNSVIPVGRYDLQINLNDLPNGSYFYVLETKNMKDTKSIIINK